MRTSHLDRVRFIFNHACTHPPTDYWAYLDHAQRFNLKRLRAFAAEGIDLAFPTQTIHLANDEKRQLALRMLNDTARNGNGEH